MQKESKRDQKQQQKGALAIIAQRSPHVKYLARENIGAEEKVGGKKA